LVTNAYRLSYLRDAQAAPDGGFPNSTTGAPPANPANTLRQDLKKNDLRNWSPTAPMLLCAGNADPSVFYLNTRLMQELWAVNLPGSQVTVLDVDSPVTGGDAPLLGRSAEAGRRELILSRGRYGCVAKYRWLPAEDIILILAVRHQLEAGYAGE
jgi:hypothetical protein